MFYFTQLREQLETYHAHWHTNVNIKESLSLSHDVRKPLVTTLTDPARSITVPPVPQQPMTLHSVDQGLLTLPTMSQPNPNHPSESSAPRLIDPAQSITASYVPQQPMTHHLLTLSTMSQPNPNGLSSGLLMSQNALAGPSSLQQPSIPMAEQLARQRVRESVENARNSSKKLRKRRTCAKCGEPTCPGSQKVPNCKNACQDCGKRECRGRNTKRPNKPCYEGWIGVEEGSRRVI